MYTLFLFSGGTALVLLVTAAFIGLFRRFLVRIINPKLVMKIHKYSGIGAGIAGLFHAFLYYSVLS